MTRKRTAIGIGTLLILVVVALLAIGLFYTNEIKNGALVVDHEPSEPDLTVASVGEGQVTLAVTDSTDLTHGTWRSDGVYGIEWDGGYAQAGPIIELGGDQVTRELLTVNGQLLPGQAVRLVGNAFDGNPSEAHRIPFDEVTFVSELGDFDAWFVAGDDDTWVIYTHGKGSNRKESLRMLPTVTSMGFSSLAITYRNDEGVPVSESGHYDYGLSEWLELEAAVRYALDHGAKDVVLVGYSMGGAITANFLYESDLASEVAAVILDAPMLDFGDVIAYGGELRGLPGAIIYWGKLVAGVQLDIDWGALDYLDRVDELEVPVLLFHGDADRTIHQRLADRFAEARPDLVTYVPFAGAEHVRSWNLDPDRYEAEVASFLEAMR